MKPEPNPYLPRVDSKRLLNLLDVGHNAPAHTIVTTPARVGGAGDFRFPDADRDGVPDLFDCEPFNPEADGWWGDAYKAAKSYLTSNYAAAARRRASVRSAVSRGARAASSYGRAAASRVRRVPTRPTQAISRHIARHITRAAAPTIKRIVSRPSPAQIKRVTAAAFPKTAATIRAAGELRKVVGAMRPPSRAELVQAGAAAVPGGIAAVGLGRAISTMRPPSGAELVQAGVSAIPGGVAAVAVVAAKPTFDAVLTRTQEMIREPPYKVEAQARTERQKYKQMVAMYEVKYPDPSKPLPEQQKYSEMADAYRAKAYDPSSPLPDAEYKQAMADYQNLMKQQMRMESEYERVVGDYQAIQEQKQIMDTTYEKTVSAGAERYLEEHQAEAPGMSPESLWIAKQTGRVARVARGFEEPIEGKMLSIEERLGLHSKWIPEPVKTVGWGVKELGYGIAFTGPAAAVEMAGMIPGGVETIVKQPAIIVPAATYGMYIMGKGAWEGVTKSPTRFAGELITLGALTKGGGIALKPVTPTIILGEGYVGVGIKGFKKPTYKTVEVKATPKEFLKYEQAAGRIDPHIYREPFAKPEPGTILFGQLRQAVGDPIAITPAAKIHITPKARGYSALHKFLDPYQKIRGADIYQQRWKRARYPPHEEVLAHELFHYKYPKFSEGKVRRMTREFGEIPSKKVFTIKKQVKTGYIREPIPFIGVRTKSGIPPIEGITATYRGIQIGRRWTPAEYYKATKIDVTPTPEGTIFEAQRAMQVRAGKLRYEKEAVARGAMEGGYFLPEAKPPVKPTFPEITTAEKGIIPLEPGKFPLSLDVVTPKPLKPTWFYGEIRRPYAKVGEARLFGSEARMRWTELGERRLIYGIEGAPKQPKLMVTTEGWGYHPTYPTGLTGAAAVPTFFRGYAPPKQISPDMYFVTKGVPASSKFFDIGHLMRPTKPKPIKPPSTKPVDRGIGAVTPRVRSEGIAPIPELKPEAPTVCIGGVCYKDVGSPIPQRAPLTKPPADAQLPYAKPPKPDPILQKMLGGVRKVERKPAAVTKPKTTIEDLVGQVEHIAKGRTLTVEGTKPYKRPRPDKRRKTGREGYTPPSFEKTDATAPFTPPFAGITPTRVEEEEDWRKTMPIHITAVEVITDTVTEPYPYPETYPYPTPTPYPEPEPEPEPEPVPDPTGEWTIMPPPKKTLPPEPRIPKGKPPKEDVKRRRKVRGEREEYEWHIGNPLITLDEFFASPPQPKKPVKPVGMIPMIPAGVV